MGLVVGELVGVAVLRRELAGDVADEVVRAAHGHDDGVACQEQEGAGGPGGGHDSCLAVALVHFIS